MVLTPRLLLALGCSAIVSPVAEAGNYLVTIGAADADRLAQVVSFPLPSDALKPAVLTGHGAAVPIQIASDGTAVFLVPEQKAGETLRYTLTAASKAKSTPGEIEARKEKGRLRITSGGAPVFEFQMDREAVPRADIKPEFKRAGYIHPVYSPTGKIVTDDYPSNHVHHHGIWTPWTKTKFQGRSPDFWNMGVKTGREDFVALDRTWSGPVHGGFEARLEMIDLSAPTPVTALNETWVVTAYNVPAEKGRSKARIFDLVVTQTCATSDAVLLPSYHYGGFGFRGAGEWNGQGEAALFLTSEGETDRIKGNTTRGRWCYLGGKLDGAVAGTAILGHPTNFRSPQPMRLHPDMPYMSFVPQQLGDFSIEPGRPYVARFRFVVTDGAPERPQLDAFWNGYALPAVVKILPDGPLPRN